MASQWNPDAGTPSWDSSGPTSTWESTDPSVPADAPSPAPQPPPPTSNEAFLFQMLADMRRVQQEQAAATNNALTTMAAAFQSLSSFMGPARAAPPPAPSVAASMHAPTSSERPLKAKEPRIFSGAAEEVEPFIDEVLTNIRLQRMTDSLDKISFLSTYLKDGNPKIWYRSLRASEETESLLYDFDSFLAAFRQHFADPNYSRTALRKMRALKQTGSCATYAARFRELLPFVELSGTTVLDMYKEGLKPAVRDVLRVVRPRPDDFEKLVKLTVEIDNDLHEDELSARDRVSSSRGNTNSNRSGSAPRQTAPTPPASSATNSTASTEVVPMEVDAVKFRGPLTQDEKDRRRRLNLCMYCGGAGHNADTCSNKSAKAKKRDAARQTPASAGKA